MLKFGLIPEFIGRLPVITTVRNLDREALIKILTEPRNAYVKQYQRLFELDGVELEFDFGALEAIADQAMLRGTGARGLRAIMEEVLLSVMYEVPEQPRRRPRGDHPRGRPGERQPDHRPARVRRPPPAPARGEVRLIAPLPPRSVTPGARRTVCRSVGNRRFHPADTRDAGRCRGPSVLVRGSEAQRLVRAVRLRGSSGQ